MDELEKNFQEEVDEQHVTKRTLDLIQKEQKENARKFCEEMVEKLSFLSKYGCEVFCDNTCGHFFIDYPYGSHTRTAEVSLITERKEFGGQLYTYFCCNGKFRVNWNWHVYANDKRDYLTTEGIVRRIARLID